MIPPEFEPAPMIAMLLAIAAIDQRAGAETSVLIPDSHYQAKPGDSIVTHGAVVAAATRKANVVDVIDSVHENDTKILEKLLAEGNVLVLEGGLGIEVRARHELQRHARKWPFIEVRIAEGDHKDTIVFLLQFTFARMIKMPEAGSRAILIDPAGGRVPLLYSLSDFDEFIRAAYSDDSDAFAHAIEKLQAEQKIMLVENNCGVEVTKVESRDLKIDLTNIARTPVHVKLLARKYKGQSAWVGLDKLSKEKRRDRESSENATKSAIPRSGDGAFGGARTDVRGSIPWPASTRSGTSLSRRP
jgi:hypothetical protein